MLKILGRITSSNVQKVVWVCEELGVPYERTDIGGAFGGNDQPGYLSQNPNGRVPTIDDDGFILWESNACTRYIAEKYGQGTPIWPADIKDRASANRWHDWTATTLSVAHGPVFVGLIRTPPEKRNPDAIAKGRNDFSKAISVLEWWFKDHDWLSGKDFGFGDIAPAPFVYRWFNLPIEREDYPNVKRWYDKIASRPGFKKYVIDTGLS